MERDGIIEMARQAVSKKHEKEFGAWLSWEEIEAFAKLVADTEREACAKVCDELAELSRISATDSMWEWGECASAIRARGNV